MTITPELIGIAVVIAAQWADSIRRSSRVETTARAARDASEETARRMEAAAADTHGRLVDHGERLSRIEGRLNGGPR